MVRASVSCVRFPPVFLNRTPAWKPGNARRRRAFLRPAPTGPRPKRKQSMAQLVHAANFFPTHAPDVDLADGNTLRTYLVGSLVVPLVALDRAKHGNLELGIGDDGGVDETGCALWPSSTLVASLIWRCRSLLGSVDVLEIGSGTAFCGMVARQLARSVVVSDREPRMRQLAWRNVMAQHALAAPTSVADYGWAEGDPWPKERFGLVVASDVLYGVHQSCRTCPEELGRFVELLECSLAPAGMIIIGHVERNSRARADLRSALERRFTVRQLDPGECLSASMYGQPGNAGVLGGVVMLCTRAPEGSALMAAAATDEPDCKLSGSEQPMPLPAQPPQPTRPPTLPPSSGRPAVASGAEHPVDRSSEWPTERPFSDRPSEADMLVSRRLGLDVRRLHWLEPTLIASLIASLIAC